MSTRGERLRQALKARGVRKQQALAAELCVHESAITRWKENASMSLSSAMALAEALDISLDWFLLGRGTFDAHQAATLVAPEPFPQPAVGRLSGKSLALLNSAIASILADSAS